jgi:hypothetical protein
VKLRPRNVNLLGILLGPVEHLKPLARGGGLHKFAAVNSVVGELGGWSGRRYQHDDGQYD